MSVGSDDSDKRGSGVLDDDHNRVESMFFVTRLDSLGGFLFLSVEIQHGMMK